MEDHIFELRRKIWIYGGSSQLYTQLEQFWNYNRSRLIGHVTEIRFRSKISHKEKNNLNPNAKIQETVPLQLVWIRYVAFYVCWPSKFCAPFRCRISSWTKVFYNLEKAEIMQHFFIGKIWLLNPDSAGSARKLGHSNNQNTMPPFPSNIFFPSRFWVGTWSAVTKGLGLTTKEGRAWEW